MKIGILTFHSAHNYGAMLQCYALQEVLKRMGHDVEVIDYRLEYRFRSDNRKCTFRQLNPLATIKSIVIKIITLRIALLRRRNFENFKRTYMALSEIVDKDHIPNDYDVYVMGSDQIWNPTITKGFDPVYFGSFWFPKGNRKYVSYAASMERSELTDEEKAFCRKSLKNFDAISVREKVLAHLLQPLTSQKVEVVLDPTLLLEKQAWERIAKLPKIKEKYVLVYQVRVQGNENTIQIAKKVAAQIKAIVIQVAVSPYLNRRKLQHESPTQFLGLMQHAACVVTTSFHGTAFSVIFNRPFYYVELGDGNDSRAKSLLYDIGLADRIIPMDSFPTFTEIDYDRVNDKVTDLRLKSAEFLKRSLSLWKAQS